MKVLDIFEHLVTIMWCYQLFPEVFKKITRSFKIKTCYENKKIFVNIEGFEKFFIQKIVCINPSLNNNLMVFDLENRDCKIFKYTTNINFSDHHHFEVNKKTLEDEIQNKKIKINKNNKIEFIPNPIFKSFKKN